VSYDPNLRLNVEPDIEVWRATLDWMLPRTRRAQAERRGPGLLYPAPIATRSRRMARAGAAWWR
jgi:fructokinase